MSNDLHLYDVGYAAGKASQMHVINKLEEQNAAFSAGQCIVENGLIGDDHGHQYCALQRRLQKLEAALQRQGDNMAFLLNHANIPSQWYGKFTEELAEDRSALKGDSE